MKKKITRTKIVPTQTNATDKRINAGQLPYFGERQIPHVPTKVLKASEKMIKK